MEQVPETMALVEQLKAIREALDGIREDIQWAVRNAQDYLAAIADSSDEIRGEILARVRYDKLPKPSLPLEETVACAHCDASADSLAEAVTKGFARLQADPEGYSYNYLGECPDCAAKMDAIPAKQQGLF